MTDLTPQIKKRIEDGFDKKSIYCCSCSKEVQARLTTGEEIYPIRNNERKDYHSYPFWKCDNCNNYVGCHHKTKTFTKPLGCIPNKEIKNARKHIHLILDPLWKHNKKRRGYIYKLISDKFGYEYHSAEIKDIQEARKIYTFILDISRNPSKYEIFD